VKGIIKDVPNLDFLETVDSEKLATKLQNTLVSVDPSRVLKIFIQVRLAKWFRVI